MASPRRCRSEGYGMDVSSLPATPMEAREVGSAYFFNGKPCPRGHVVARYTKGGRCSFCTREDSARRRGREFDGTNKRSSVNFTRIKAFSEQSATYISSSPCPHGHFVRWTLTSNCVECDRAARARRSEARKYYRIKKLYGLDAAEYEAMMGGSCAICGAKASDTFKLHVDHCHESGRVRGVLCNKCNQGLGLFNDSGALLLAAMEYLKK